MSTIIIQATDEQISQMAANAVNVSSPAGLGYLHFNAATKFTAADFTPGERELYLDYVEGRMVKFYVRRHGANKWQANYEPRTDYQSWAFTYPTFQALAKSVGAVAEATDEGVMGAH